MAAKFVARPATTVIAAVRDPLATSSVALQQLPTGESSRMIIVKIDSASQDDPAAAIRVLRSEHQVQHLDVVIANAAIGKTYPEVSALTCKGITIEDMYEHFTINTIGPLLLFRAALPLLEKSTRTPKFVVMSSFAASLGAMADCPYPNAAYGPSKAGVNYLSRKMHFEHEFLTTFALNPGWVLLIIQSLHSCTMGLIADLQIGGYALKWEMRVLRCSA